MACDARDTRRADFDLLREGREVITRERGRAPRSTSQCGRGLSTVFRVSQWFDDHPRRLPCGACAQTLHDDLEVVYRLGNVLRPHGIDSFECQMFHNPTLAHAFQMQKLGAGLDI